jgi:Tol biopolymer transport system component
VYLVDLTGGAASRQLVDRLPPLALGQTDAYLTVAWSPDGTQAIVVRPYPHGMALLSLGDSTSTLLPIVAQQPNFSPDGKQIALAFTAPGKPVASVYTGALDQLGAVTKVSSSADYETAPLWLADGSGIVYVAAADRWEVRKVASGNSTPSMLAQAPLGYIISDVAVAPAGDWIAYTLQSTADGHRYVHISSTLNPALGLDVPQERPWNDRVLGWVRGS